MIKYDQDSISRRLIESTKKHFGDVDLVLFGTNKRIFDIVSEELAGAMAYDEYQTRETKWSLAKNYSSLLSQSEFYNYRPSRKVGAFGLNQISASETFDGGIATNVVIPKWTKLSNGELTFLTTEEKILTSGSNYVEVPVRQGIFFTLDFEITTAQYPSGTSFVKIDIENNSLENTTYEVFVNGQKWQEVPHIRLADTGSRSFVVDNKKDFSGIEIKFGDGNFGKRLSIGDIVTFKGIQTKGESGNILRRKTLNKLSGTFFDSLGQEVKLYTQNLEALSGGSSYESRESIRVNAPQNYQAGNRAVTRKDYETLILTQGYADKISVWGEEEINQDRGNPPGTFLSTAENLIYIAGFSIDSLTGEGLTLSKSQQQIVRNYLNDRKSPSDILQFVDVDFLYVVFDTHLWISDKQFTEGQVRYSLTEKLKNVFGLVNSQMKKNLYLSNYEAVIDEVSGVDHHVTTISFVKLNVFSSAYVFTQNLGVNNIKPNTVKIWIQFQSEPWSLMARDNGSGLLVGEPIDPNDSALGDYQLPGAEINYSNGVSNDLTVTLGLSEDFSFYKLKVEFEVEDSEGGNLFLTSREQIQGFYDNTAVVSFMDSALER